MARSVPGEIQAHAAADLENLRKRGGRAEIQQTHGGDSDGQSLGEAPNLLLGDGTAAAVTGAYEKDVEHRVSIPARSRFVSGWPVGVHPCPIGLFLHTTG